MVNHARVRFASLLAVVVGLASACRADDAVRYADHIQPILKRHCLACHGAGKQESGLRLDSGAAMRVGGDRGRAIVPGKSDESPLYLALFGRGDIEAMPYEKPRLPDEQIALIKRWIDQGAMMPKDDPGGDGTVASDHWSFTPAGYPVPPRTDHPGLVRTAIDAFVQSRLDAEGLRLSNDAQRSTLVRRASLDLIGILPTVSEVDAFVSDDSPDAFERVVDRLLSSPRYGERWGRHWLDLARYADSNGYTIDGPRKIWKYRDWVVDALNRDLPFDQFTVQQLAGDLLPDASIDQLIATGFHRNTLINQEGGTDAEQYRVDSIYDRISTTGTVWLGLTVGCAQCHSHKFDPITQREFYQLFAIFNNCDEPQIPVPTAEQAERQKTLKHDLAAATKPLEAHDAQLLKGLDAWVTQITAGGDTADAWTVLKPGEMSSERGTLLALQDDDSVFSDFSIPPNDTFIISTVSPGELITAIRLEALTHDSLPNKGPGRADNGNFVLSEFEMDIVSGDRPTPVRFTNAVADHSQTGYGVAAAIDSNRKTGWAINVKKGSLNVNREATFFPAKPIRLAPGTRLTFRLRHDHEVQNYLLGRFRISVTSRPASQFTVPKAIRDIAATPGDRRSKDQQTQLENAFKSTDPARKSLADRVARLKKTSDALTRAIPTTMVMRPRKAPRTTHVHIRGDFLRKGDEVLGAVPAVLHQLETEKPAPDRMDFARWLFEADNPLTGRVTVNRFWQRFFGKGLVETENDFGTQGSRPSHPELLDWLAREFERKQWGVKSFHRLILTSSTYRQSSDVDPELLTRDPANRLLARQSRLRLEAEAIRDVALSASGLLSDNMGGPGVYPPQPEGLYIVTQVKKAWPESKGEARYRRAIYTYLWRSSIYPMFPTFDAPNANNCVSRRSRSNTPLQALTLANDRAFIEFTEGLGARIVAEAPTYDEGRVRYAFRVCLSRDPGDDEVAALLGFVERERSAAADDAPETTIWNAVARVVMNLDEFITRE